MIRWLRTTLRLVLSVVVAGLIGLLLAGVALPLVVGAGIAAKLPVDRYLVLPTHLEPPVLPRRSRILAVDGSLVAWLYLENRVPVRLEQVPEHARQAVITIEDVRFYAHSGVDVQGVVRAAITNWLSGDVQQGASTLTQQYVKNVLLKTARTPQERARATDLTLARKIREVRYAVALERRMSKDEILQRYLNIAYYGNGAYGIGTAAEYYFGKPVGKLTLAEGATLAGIVRSPNRHNPVDAPAAAVARRDVVLARMAQAGHLTEQERAAAAAEALTLDVKPIGSGCEAPAVPAPFFCDYVRRALEQSPLGAALGGTRNERQQRLLGGGLTIRTTLHPDIQRTAQHTLNEQVPQADPSGAATTYTAVEPGTGKVLALAVNRSFGEAGVAGQTKLNLPLGGSSGMQAGSAFKPFVLAAALERGLPLNTTFHAPARYSSRVFKNCDGRSCDNPYTVRNAGDSSAGRHDLVSGTRSSVNTFYLQLLERTGVERPAQIAEGFGLRQFRGGAPSAPMHRGGSLVLGVNEVSPLAMAAAYAGLAARGVYCPPRPVTSISSSDGTPIELPAKTCQRVLEPAVADTMTAILRGVVDGPWPRTGRRASIGRPVAGKTGTTNGAKAAWFIGYTPQLAAAVWVGKPVPEPLQRITINGQYYPQLYGGTLPARIWSLITGHVLRDAPVAELPPPARSNPTPARPEDTGDREGERPGRSGAGGGPVVSPASP